MSDFKKENMENEEFQNKKVSSTALEFDEELLSSMNSKGRNIRSLDDNDESEDLSDDEVNGFELQKNNSKNANMDSDDIINSLINYSEKQKDMSAKSNGEDKDGLLGKVYGKISKGKKEQPEIEKPVKKEKPAKKEKVKKSKSEKKGFSLFDKKEKTKEDINTGDIEELTEDISDEESITENSKEEDFQQVENINSEIINDDVDHEPEDDIKINTIEDIEKNIRSKSSKSAKNLLIIIGVAIGCILALFMLASIVLGMFSKPKTTVPPIEKVDTIEVGDDIDTGNYISEKLIEKQGYIKRILGDKIVIVPDDETEDVIYYLTDTSLTEGISAGAHIQYGYNIINYLPRISAITEIKTGEVVYKGIMTVNVMIDKNPEKFSYTKELEETMKTIRTGDKISYVSKEIDGVMTITNIIKINGASNNGSDTSYEVESGENPVTDDLYSGYVFNKDDFYEEYLVVDNRPEESLTVTKTHLKDNTIKFYNGITDPVWIRFAWRITDIAPSVPNIENVDLILETPSGVKLNYENIDEYGRMWIDGNIINYALKSPEIGEYKITTNKPKGTNLGEAQLFVLGLSGFITIDKFGANLLDRDNLELIWNIGGVPDDGLEIEVYLTNDRFSTMIYSASSKEEVLHTIDRKVVSISNLPKGKYNVIVKVKDLDLKTQADNPEIPENTILVSAETITDTKNVGILILQ